jgi:hypothetical protein
VRRLAYATLCLLPVVALAFACSSGDDSTLDAALVDSSSTSDAAPTQADATAPDAAPPPPPCDVIVDASFPDVYYPSISVPCTKAGDSCTLPPNECVFDRYRVRYLKGYCSSSLMCVFTYSRDECSGADPVGCDAGACTCGP